MKARDTRTAAAIALALAVAAPVWAAPGDVNRKLESVERALAEGRSHERALESKAASLERAIVALRAELVTTARAVQNHEERLTMLEGRLAELAQAEMAASAGLGRRRADLVATLGALERLGRRPPEALLATTATLTDTVRTSLLLSAAVPALDNDARSLRDELARLAGLRRDMAAEKGKIAAAAAELAASRRQVAALLERKSALQDATLNERRQAEKRVARLASEAKDLRGLLERIMTAPAPPDSKPETTQSATATDTAVAALPATGQGPAWATRSFSAARGTLPLPVRGRVSRLYGQETANGTRDKGLTIESRAGAQVVTPYDGRVVFAGPFRGYGQLLIIEYGEGYHMLLAGFSRIDSVLGQWLLAGEPVGVMGPGKENVPSLYVELRRNGESINPLPWLAASTRKVSG